ncbi:unnamed protein product [Paramecium primaurelia]|uniref:Uncharacterized protein n=1 Tax=Paramecium primaurelia TaxID=5886 RepID=A0A8S1QEB7_PARPR|nr:unnamed protein product [Paramecium primaurelia]
MQKQHLNYILTPSSNSITKTPEKAINTSPFRGCSFSDKQSMTPNKQYIGYPHIQQTINQNIQHQFPYYENASPFSHETKEQLMQRILNLEDNLKAINKKYDQLKDDLEKERYKKYDTDRCYQQLFQRYQDQESELLKHQSVAKSIENMYKQVQKELQEYKEKLNVRNNEIQELKTIQEKFQKIMKLKEREINEFKIKLLQEKNLGAQENERLVQEFNQTYRDLTQQNDQLLQENSELKSIILEFDNQPQTISTNKQSENFQYNQDSLNDQELRQIVQQYLTNNEEYLLNKIPENQFRKSVQIMKEIFHTVTSKNSKEIKSLQFQEYKQINEEIEINLQELKKKRDFLIKEIKYKMDEIVKTKEFNLMKFNEILREIEELKKKLLTVENLIQEMEQSLMLNPHRNSCVSFDNQEFL